ncbi:unnamed protein product, partial [Discosporangium mesarthrocarpum]
MEMSTSDIDRRKRRMSEPLGRKSPHSPVLENNETQALRTNKKVESEASIKVKKAHSTRRRRSHGTPNYSPYSPMVFDYNIHRRASAPPLPSKNFFGPSETFEDSHAVSEQSPTLEQCLVLPPKLSGENSYSAGFDNQCSPATELILGGGSFLTWEKPDAEPQEGRTPSKPAALTTVETEELALPATASTGGHAGPKPSPRDILERSSTSYGKNLELYVLPSGGNGTVEGYGDESVSDPVAVDHDFTVLDATHFGDLGGGRDSGWVLPYIRVDAQEVTV